MNYVVGMLIVLLVPAAGIVGTMALNLRSSDAAGNGLALVYTLFFIGVLWALLGLTLLIACIRRPNPALAATLPWTLIGVAAVVLFLAAAASQVATIAVLADRRTAGVYQLVLRAAVFAAPIAFLAHSAWRTYGPGVPAWTGTWLCAGVAAACIVAPWPGVVRAARPAPAPSVPAVTRAEDLHYPAILVWDTTRVTPIDGPADLQTMHSNSVLHRDDDPVVIDSTHRAFKLAGLRTQKGALALWVNGPGAVAVEYTLEALPGPSTSARTREMVLACRWLSVDRDRDAAIRANIAQRETIESMIVDLRSE